MWAINHVGEVGAGRKKLRSAVGFCMCPESEAVRDDSPGWVLISTAPGPLGARGSGRAKIPTRLSSINNIYNIYIYIYIYIIYVAIAGSGVAMGATGYMGTRHVS